MGLLPEDSLKITVLILFLAVCCEVSGDSGTEMEPEPDFQVGAFQDLFLPPNDTEDTSLSSRRQADRNEGLEDVHQILLPFLSNSQSLLLPSKSSVKSFQPTVSKTTHSLASADNTTDFEIATSVDIPPNTISMNNLSNRGYEEQTLDSKLSINMTGNPDIKTDQADSNGILKATLMDVVETPTAVSNVSEIQKADPSWDLWRQCPEMLFSCRRTFLVSKALPCSCDRFCLLYNDCCHDIQSVVPNVYEAAVLTRSQYEEIETSCLTTNFLTISNCPASARAKNASLAELCGAELQLRDINSIPVTDKATGLNFANTYCALCHGVLPENIIILTADMTLHGYRALMVELNEIWAADDASITEGFNSFLRLFSRGSGFLWKPATEHRDQSRPCVPDAIATCPDVFGKAHPLSHACHFGPSAYVWSTENGRLQYRNPSCLVCNALSNGNRTCEVVVNPKTVIRSPDFSGLLRGRPDSSGLDVSIRVVAPNHFPGLLPWTDAICSFSNAVHCKISRCKESAVISSIGTCMQNQTVSLHIDMSGDFALYWLTIWYNERGVDSEGDIATPFCREVFASLLQQPTLSSETATYVDVLGMVKLTSLECQGVIRKAMKQRNEPYEIFHLEMSLAVREVLARRHFTGLISFCTTAQYVHATKSCLDPDAHYTLLRIGISPALGSVTESGSSQAGSLNVWLVLLVFAWEVCFVL